MIVVYVFVDLFMFIDISMFVDVSMHVDVSMYIDVAMRVDVSTHFDVYIVANRCDSTAVFMISDSSREAFSTFQLFRVSECKAAWCFM